MSKQINIAQQRKNHTQTEDAVCAPYLVRRAWEQPEQHSRESPIAQVQPAVRPELGNSRNTFTRLFLTG